MKIRAAHLLCWLAMLHSDKFGIGFARCWAII